MCEGGCVWVWVRVSMGVRESVCVGGCVRVCVCVCVCDAETEADPLYSGPIT